jgi:hypothetical protein
MSRARLLVLLQTVLAAIVVVVVAFFVPGTPSVLAELSHSGWLAIALAASALLLGLFSVWLPRGDFVDTTAAISFAAGAALQPVVAVLVISGARVATSMVRSHGLGVWAVLENLSRRALLMSLTYAVVGTGLVGRLGSEPQPTDIARVGVAVLCFFAVDLLLEQVHSSVRLHVPYLRGLLGTLRMQGWIVAAQLSVASLTVLLLPSMGPGGLIISSGLLLVMRQSFALLLEVKASYTSTVEMLARSIEAYDSSRRGHAERVSRMVSDAGRTLGFQSHRLEDLVNAALFHDVGRLGTDDQQELPDHRSSEVLSNVGFLAGSVPLLQILDTAADAEASLDEQDLIGAYLIAYFSALDSELNMGRAEGYELATSIGVRLYANTRRTVDRAIRRVERDARRAEPTQKGLETVVT